MHPGGPSRTPQPIKEIEVFNIIERNASAAALAPVG